MHQARVDRWLGPILMLLAALWSWMVIDTIPAAEQAGEAGPRGFPLLMGVALAALSLLMTIWAWRPVRGDSDRSRTVARVTRAEIRIVGLTFALFCAYGFLMEKIGFLLATPLVVVLALAGILRMKSWTITLSLALGLTGACFLIFIVLMEAPLPRGMWVQVY